MNKHIIPIILIIVTLCAGVYWFQIRPMNIKKVCSWVTKHTDATIGRTQEEINRLYPGCKIFDSSKYDNFIDESVAYTEFTKNNANVCPKPIQTQPAKEWQEPASQYEYQFCLHSHGL